MLKLLLFWKSYGAFWKFCIGWLIGFVIISLVSLTRLFWLILFWLITLLSAFDVKSISPGLFILFILFIFWLFNISIPILISFPIGLILLILLISLFSSSIISLKILYPIFNSKSICSWHILENSSEEFCAELIFNATPRNWFKLLNNLNCAFDVSWILILYLLKKYEIPKLIISLTKSIHFCGLLIWKKRWLFSLSNISKSFWLYISTVYSLDIYTSNLISCSQGKNFINSFHNSSEIKLHFE